MTRDLLVTSPPLSGDDVLALQRRLGALGYDPGPLDGVYGPATAAAVVDLQGDRGLTADGIVGPRTRAALADDAPVPPHRPSETATGALAVALRHLGEREQPAGSNRTPFGRWFGVDGVPWCAIFVSYCFAVGAGLVLCAGFRGAGVTARGCAYVPTLEAWLRATGRWRGLAAPLPGDIVVYELGGATSNHVGIVETRKDEAVVAVEGNTHGEVARRVRPPSLVAGFGRIR